MTLSSVLRCSASMTSASATILACASVTRPAAPAAAAGPRSVACTPMQPLSACACHRFLSLFTPAQLSCHAMQGIKHEHAQPFYSSLHLTSPRSIASWSPMTSLCHETHQHGVL